MWRFASIFDHTADFGQHAEITFQRTLNRDYTLQLYIRNEAVELQMQDSQTWTPAQRPHVSYSPVEHSLMTVYV